MHLIVREVVFYLYYESSFSLRLIDDHYLQKSLFLEILSRGKLCILLLYANQQVNPQIIP